MGRTLSKVAKQLASPARVLSPSVGKDIRVENLRRVGVLDDYRIDNPKPVDVADQVVKDRLDDRSVYMDNDIAPRAIAREAIDSTGDPEAATRANLGLYDAIASESKPTRMFKDTLTGKLPSLIYPGTVHTSRVQDFGNPIMGDSRNVAVTKVTPQMLMQGLMGSPTNANRTRYRLQERNMPHGLDKAAIYHLDDLAEEWQRPWMIYRGTKNGFDESDGTKGFIDQIGKSMFLNRSGDQMAAGDFDEVSRGMNTFIHEANHTGLHGENPSLDFLFYQGHPELGITDKTRPAIADINRGKLVTPMGRYLSSGGDELGNLLFHTKRLTELVEPGMRDVGASQGSVNNWLDWALKYQPTGRDPRINLKGHSMEGAPAHGLEKQIEAIQDIHRSYETQDGLDDFENNMNFKTSSTKPNFRTALLS